MRAVSLVDHTWMATTRGNPTQGPFISYVAQNMSREQNIGMLVGNGFKTRAAPRPYARIYTCS